MLDAIRPHFRIPCGFTFLILVTMVGLHGVRAGTPPMPAPGGPSKPPAGSAQAWLDEVASPLRAAKHLELRFAALAQMPESESPERYLGTFWMGDSSRFRLEIPTGVYVSDGKTFWEFHPGTRQVLVRDARDLAGRALPGRILLDLLSRPPLGCDTVNLGGKSRIRIQLKPDAHTGPLDSLEIHVDPKSRKLETVATLDANGGRMRYEIQSWKKAAIPARRFRFDPPKSAEVVDMRP